MTLVLSSHQMEDVAALAERLTVLADGRSILDGSVADVFAQGERLRALGLSVPVVTQVAEGLQARGWTLPSGLVSQAALIEALAQRI